MTSSSSAQKDKKITFFYFLEKFQQKISLLLLLLLLLLEQHCKTLHLLLLLLLQQLQKSGALCFFCSSSNWAFLSSISSALPCLSFSLFSRRKVTVSLPVERLFLGCLQSTEVSFSSSFLLFVVSRLSMAIFFTSSAFSLSAMSSFLFMFFFCGFCQKHPLSQWDIQVPLLLLILWAKCHLPILHFLFLLSSFLQGGYICNKQ